MGEQISVAKEMVKDHNRVGNLLMILKQNMDQSHEQVLKLLDNFMWHLEKHFFIEEKIVLIDYHPTDEKTSEELSETLKEHERILDMVRRMAEDLKQSKKIQIEPLYDLLLKHKEYEDEVLYPLLDLELKESQKKIIVEKINDYYKWQ
ncbi:MAG: hemerythrin domain-containing protein [archaeon]